MYRNSRSAVSRGVMVVLTSLKSAVLRCWVSTKEEGKE